MPSAETPISEDRDEQEPQEDRADTDGSAEIPISGTRAERYQVFLHVEPDTLRADGGEGLAARGGVTGRSHLEDGTRLAAETARRLCCDVAMVTVARGSDGSVLDIGRRSRSIPPAIDRAMKIRDGGYCRFPGCNVRFTDGHHVIHWADGGETKLTNLVSLCVYHHRKLHEGGWRLRYDADDDIAEFIDPRGHVRYDARPRTPAPLFGEEADATSGAGGFEEGVEADAEVTTGARAAEALAERNRARGVDPDGEKLRARYRRESDIPWDVLASALEALDEAHFGEHL